MDCLALKDVFLQKNAGTYFGYNAAVTNAYINFETEGLLNNIIIKGTTTEDALQRRNHSVSTIQQRVTINFGELIKICTQRKI